MFDKTPNTAPATPATPQEGDKQSGIVVHTMPREFYGKEAAMLESAQPKPEQKPITPPPQQPKPAPVIAAPTLNPAAAPIVLKKRSWPIVLGMALLFIGVLGAGGYFAYVRIMEEQQRREEAEAALIKEQEDAAKRARELAEQQQRQEEESLVPTPATDTDSDGLTDIEERLYGTNERDPDSDEDTFLDGNEVFHRYHPLGVAPSTLLDTGAVKVLDELTYDYTLYYPSSWSVALSREAFGVTFKSARQASIQLTWSEKDGLNESLAEWFAREVVGGDIGDYEEMMTKNGYYGLVTADDRTAYIDIGEAVVKMVYDLGEKNQIEYLQTFQMMVNSLEYVEREEAATP